MGGSGLMRYDASESRDSCKHCIHHVLPHTEGLDDGFRYTTLDCWTVPFLLTCMQRSSTNKRTWIHNTKTS